MLDTTLYHIRKIIPASLFSFAQPAYHFGMALLGALVYRFPSRSIKIVAVTGTKGKTSVTEITNAILEEAEKIVKADFNERTIKISRKAVEDFLLIKVR